MQARPLTEMPDRARQEPGRPGRLDHLVRLGAVGGPAQHLGLWPWAALRAAGFPAERVEALAAPELAAEIERTLDQPGGADRAALAASFARESARIGEAIRAVAQDAQFREAVIWQNHHAFRTGIDPLARSPAGAGNKKARQRERLVASYLQRYCVRNDTIGFFGPVGWARLGAGSAPIRARPGPALLDRRTVYYENWCIDALAARLSEDPALRPWLAPRLLPYFRLEGGRLEIPFADPVELPPAQRRLLELADGTRSARELVRALLADPSLGLSREEEVYELLEQGRAMGVVSWGLDVALQLHPESEVRRLRSAVGDGEVRARALAPLDALDAGRARVAAAAGDPAALDAAMEELGRTFQALTGASPTRASGQTYAARTLVYEDCRRDYELELGAPVLERLGRPLSLLLLSARWLTHQIAARYRQALLALFEQLAPPGQRSLALLPFHKAFYESEPSLAEHHGLSPRLADLQEELRRRWAEILAAPAGARRLHYRVEELLPEVLRRFDAPSPGWAAARYSSPDVLLAAPSVAAIERGELCFVLGELHLNITLSASLFVSQHPAPRELEALLERDDPGPGVMPVPPDKQGWNQRNSQVLIRPGDFRYLYGRDPCPAAPGRLLRAADLVVEREGDRLEVRHRDRPERWDLIEFMGVALSMLSNHAHDILPERPHTPRIAFDDLIVSRESWVCPARELDFAGAADPLDRWIGAKRWQRAQGLPRRVFLKCPVERKPYFIDFDSPILVDILAKLTRLSVEADPEARLSLSEMLPDLDGLWLRDQAGRRYTNELRLVVFDGAGMADPPAPG